MTPEPEEPTAAADCDVCNANEWHQVGSGRRTKFVCGGCESVYTYDGMLLIHGPQEGTHDRTPA